MAYQTPSLKCPCTAFPELQDSEGSQNISLHVEEKMKQLLTGDIFISWGTGMGKEVKRAEHTSWLSGLAPTVIDVSAFASYWNFTFQESSLRACLPGFSKSFIIGHAPGFPSGMRKLRAQFDPVFGSQPFVCSLTSPEGLNK